MIKLDTSTYQERFQRAIDEWKLLSHNEEVYESDVSYTLLEMQTMLTDMLYYYMESVTSQHKKKYEKLLCKQETERSPISIPFQMQVDIPRHIHTGQQFKKEVEGGIVCFESMHAYNLQPNSFLAIHYQDEQHEEDISELLRYIEGTYVVENKQEAKIYFELEHALPIQKQIAFYICVEKNRNPVPYFQKNTSNSQLQEEKYTIDMQQFDIQMADITWQYESLHGWQDIEIIKDDTKGFLVSGEVVFQIGKQMKTATYNNMQTYRLRIIMKHMHYDKPPGLQSIWMNTILVNAQECDAKTFNFQNDGVCSVHIADDIAYANTTLQYVNEQGHWITHEVSKREMEEYCCFTWNSFPIPASLYRIVAQRSTLQDKVSSFDTTGISMQKIDIETGSGYALSIMNEKQEYVDCTCKESYEAGDGSLGYYKEETGLRFGNGRDFTLPNAVCNAIFFTHFITYKHELPPLAKESFIIHDTHMTGKNAITTNLYQRTIPHQLLCYSKEDIKEFIEHIPYIALSYIRVSDCIDATWTVYIMGDIASNQYQPYTTDYKMYIQQTLQQALPMMVYANVVEIKMIPVSCTITLLMRQQEHLLEDYIRGVIKEYVLHAMQSNTSIFTQDIVMLLQKQSDIVRVIACYFIIDDKPTEYLAYNPAYMYQLSDIEIRQPSR